MAFWKNEKPSLVGLNHASGSEARLIGPGEVFEADASEIPKGLLDAGWVKPSKVGPPPRAAAIPQPGIGSSADQPRLVGVDPSPTDAEAAASKAYEPGTSPAERAAKTAELERQQAENAAASTADKPGDAPKPIDTPQGSFDDTKAEDAKSGFFGSSKKK